MRMNGTFRIICSVLMSLILSNLPSLASATEMLPTTVVVTELNRAEAQRKVETYLEQEQVRNELIKRGVSPDEVSLRLASLSDSELRQLSGQIEQARYGGNILMTILIVLLIIFLVKRI